MLSSVRPIQIIYRNVDLKCFFSILPKCLFVIIDVYAYFINISQGTVETHLRCGGICNNHVIANCLRTVPVGLKNFENWLIIGEAMDKSKVSRILAHPVV